MTLLAREHAFLEEFRKADLGDGVGIPVFGPDGRVGQCGLGFRKGVLRLDPTVLKEFAAASRRILSGGQSA